jgi:hypothetical protein
MLKKPRLVRVLRRLSRGTPSRIPAFQDRRSESEHHAANPPLSLTGDRL